MKNFAIAISFVALLLLAAACRSNSDSGTGQVIKTHTINNNLTVTLSNKDCVLRHGDEEFFLAFRDASGRAVDVGAVALNSHMPAMGTMAVMNNPARFTTTNTPGVYRGRANIEMAGEWQVQITYEGPAGQGRTSFPVTAQ